MSELLFLTLRPPTFFHMAGKSSSNSSQPKRKAPSRVQNAPTGPYPFHEGLAIALGGVAVMLFSVAATQAAEPKRVALVIGNSEYAASPLKNPSNDADAVLDVVHAQ